MNLRGDEMWLRSMYVSLLPLIAEYNFSAVIVGGFVKLSSSHCSGMSTAIFNWWNL